MEKMLNENELFELAVEMYETAGIECGYSEKLGIGEWASGQEMTEGDARKELTELIEQDKENRE